MSGLIRMLKGLLDRADDKRIGLVLGAVAGAAIVLAAVLPIVSMSSSSAATGQPRLTCPSCQHKFKGGEVKMVGPGDCRCRVAGQEKSVTLPTQTVVCPSCRTPLPDPHTAMIRNPAHRPKL